MSKSFVALSVLVASVGLASGAHAQQAEYRTDDGYRTNGQAAAAQDARRDDRRDHYRFGEAGQFALSAERMFGVGFIWDRTDLTDDETVSTRSFNLSVLSNPLANVTTTYTFPRMGFDYFVADGLSIGASLGFAWTTFDADEDDVDVDVFNVDRAWAFLAAPRIGYAFMFGDNVGIWPRIGVSWLWNRITAADDASLRINRFALTFEAPFVISPTENVALLVGPMLDLGVSGSNRFEGFNGDIDIDARSTELGVNVGFLAYF